MYASFLFCLRCFIVSLILSRWSTVAFDFCPPACTSVILIFGVIILLLILSNRFPKLLVRVIPLSFEHLPLTPFALYSLVISPIYHWSGILNVWINLLISFRYISPVCWLACVNISFGNLSGLGALFFFSVVYRFAELLYCRFFRVSAAFTLTDIGMTLTLFVM